MIAPAIFLGPFYTLIIKNTEFTIFICGRLSQNQPLQISGKLKPLMHQKSEKVSFTFLRNINCFQRLSHNLILGGMWNTSLPETSKIFFTKPQVGEAAALNKDHGRTHIQPCHFQPSASPQRLVAGTPYVVVHQSYPPDRFKMSSRPRSQYEMFL